jgi:single-strand DNA-binding protein
MNEPFVTLQGWVGNDVVFRTTKQGNVANFRIGCTPRIRRNDGEWTDGQTSWFSVSCWRALAENVRDSVKKGQPVLVHGRLQADIWKREDGQTSVIYVVVAQHVGHDLTRGTSAFLRTTRTDRGDVDDDGDPDVKAVLHGLPEDLPQLDGFGNEVGGPGQSPAA